MEYSKTNPASLQNHVLGMLGLQLQVAQKAGILHAPGVSYAVQTAKVRHAMSHLHDTLTYHKEPNTERAYTVFSLDLLILLYVADTSLACCMESSCFQYTVLLSAFLLVMPFLSCLDMLSVLEDPFSGDADYINADSLISQAEVQTYHILRSGFDFDTSLDATPEDPQVAAMSSI